MPSTGSIATRDKHTKWRESIQTTKVLKRLQNYVLAEKDSEEYKKNVMTPTQVNAARMLLDRTLPAIKIVEHEGEIDHRAIMVVAPSQIAAEEWLKLSK
jgi:hypothetical protein